MGGYGFCFWSAIWEGLVSDFFGMGGNGTGKCYLGIKTPGLQRISRSPKGWVPRMYCKGIPLDRSRHNWRSMTCHFAMRDVFLATSKAFSRSQRSSLRAELRSRQGRRSKGKRGC